MSKIEWCDLVYNPVWGCNTGCPYCYARRIAKRFVHKIINKEYPYHERVDFCDIESKLLNFKPQWIESNFQRKFPKKPKRIFVNSMSDIWWWKPEWMERVLKRIKEYPQHIFLFLTKFPKVYLRYTFPKNCWLGITVTSNKDIKRLIKDDLFCYQIDSIPRLMFLSVEPILERIDLKGICFDWVILGAETGYRPEKVVPKYEWIWDIWKYCLKNRIPFFMKNNLEKIFPNMALIQEFPGGRGE